MLQLVQGIDDAEVAIVRFHQQHRSARDIESLCSRMSVGRAQFSVWIQCST